MNLKNKEGMMVNLQFITLGKAIEYITEVYGSIDHIRWDGKQLIFFDNDTEEICCLKDEVRSLDTCKEAIHSYMEASEEPLSRSWLEGWIIGLHTVSAITDEVRDQLIAYLSDLLMEGRLINL